MYTSNPLPIGARRALREYRNAEAQHSFAQIQNKTRAVAIKLLAGRKVVGVGTQTSITFKDHFGFDGRRQITLARI